MTAVRPTRLGWLFAAVVLGTNALSSAVLADEITSKGIVLQGTVKRLSSSDVTFEPELGSGAIVIDWENIEAIKAEGNFQVLYGDGLQVIGPISGLSDGKILVGADPASAVAIATGDIYDAMGLDNSHVSWQERMRSYWRYWDGSFDAAVSIQRATTDTTGFLLGFRTKRTKDPTRLSLGADYRYSTQKKDGESEETVEDRAFGFTRGEYDFTHRFFAFASTDATYDGVQSLSLRAVPKSGVGYLIWEQDPDGDRNFLSGEVGAAMVYEKYFGGTDDTYFSIAFGATAGYHLPYGAHFDWRLDYLPAVDDWANDFLVRNELSLTFPLIDPIAAKFSFVDEYNNDPADGAKKNGLYTNFGLSVVW